MPIFKGTEKYSSGSLAFSEREESVLLILPCPFPTIKDTFLAILDVKNSIISVSKSTSRKAYIMIYHTIMLFIFMIYSPLPHVSKKHKATQSQRGQRYMVIYKNADRLVHGNVLKLKSNLGQ